MILIDSIKTKDGIPGNIYTFSPDLETYNLSSSHTTNFLDVLKLGKKMGYKIPEKIKIYAVEIKNNTDFTEKCTPEIERCIPEVVQKIIDELKS